jgi:hypothetical protein
VVAVVSVVVVSVVVVSIVPVSDVSTEINVSTEISLSLYLVPSAVFSSTTAWPLLRVSTDWPPEKEPPATPILTLPAEMDWRVNVGDELGKLAPSITVCEVPLTEITAAT